MEWCFALFVSCFNAGFQILLIDLETMILVFLKKDVENRVILLFVELSGKMKACVSLPVHIHHFEHL